MFYFNLKAEVATLREQVTLAKQRMFDSRNQNLTLKSELKQMHRLLQSEVGEAGIVMHGNTPSVATGWRGRAQQIIALQNKIAELQQKCGLSGGSSRICYFYSIIYGELNKLQKRVRSF